MTSWNDFMRPIVLVYFEPRHALPLPLMLPCLAGIVLIFLFSFLANIVLIYSCLALN